MFPHNRIQAMHLQQEYHRDGTAFSLHSTQWHTISIYPTIGGINFDHLVQVVPARFLYYKVTFLPLQLRRLLWRDTLRQCKYSIPPFIYIFIYITQGFLFYSLDYNLS